MKGAHYALYFFSGSLYVETPQKQIPDVSATTPHKSQRTDQEVDNEKVCNNEPYAPLPFDTLVNPNSTSDPSHKNGRVHDYPIPTESENKNIVSKQHAKKIPQNLTLKENQQNKNK